MPRKSLQGRTCGVSRDGERARTSRDGRCAWLRARAHGRIPRRPKGVWASRLGTGSSKYRLCLPHDQRARRVERSSARIG
ncbi:hypothetical protein XarbCFBP7629_08075 [Xanthomonas arboricola]|nr:hypothetical protein XarbCFBP7629_08075 [Xanthomonas arboricola]